MTFSRCIAAGLLVCLPAVNVAAQTRATPLEPAPSMDRGTWLLPQAYEVELALSAGPEHLRADATVYVFGSGGYEKVRAGTNGFTCLVNRDRFQSGDRTLRPTCWDAEGGVTIVPVMLRVGELLAQAKTATEISRDLESGFDDGRFSAPHKAGIAYMLRGDVQVDPNSHQVNGQSFPPHYMIYAPGVSNRDIGISEDAAKDHFALPFVYAGYSGGSRTRYIIVLATEGKGHSH
ncbi:MAG: hypothetical protein ABI460_10655 [Caldimonas sp.]